MKAIDKLIELRKTDSSIVAIVKGENGIVEFIKNKIPWVDYVYNQWINLYLPLESNYIFDEEITFDSENWQECIVTINDLENYEVKMMSISVQEYERLLQAEKTLQNIISKR